MKKTICIQVSDTPDSIISFVETELNTALRGITKVPYGWSFTSSEIWPLQLSYVSEEDNKKIYEHFQKLGFVVTHFEFYSFVCRNTYTLRVQ